MANTRALVAVGIGMICFGALNALIGYNMLGERGRQNKVLAQIVPNAVYLEAAHAQTSLLHCLWSFVHADAQEKFRLYVKPASPPTPQQ